MTEQIEKSIENAVKEENWEEVYHLAQRSVYENDSIEIREYWYWGASDIYNGYVACEDDEYYEYDFEVAKAGLREDLVKFIDSLFIGDVENKLGIMEDDIKYKEGYSEKLNELAKRDAESLETEYVFEYYEKYYEKYDNDYEKEEALSSINNYSDDDFEELKDYIQNGFTDEELENADWEYSYDETTDSPYAEATAVIDGKNVTVGYLWDVQEGGCYAHIDDKDVEDEDICEHYCEVVEKKIGKKLTGLSYDLYESWVEYHLHDGLDEFNDLYEGWEDMDEDERYECYLNARAAF